MSYGGYGGYGGYGDDAGGGGMEGGFIQEAGGSQGSPSKGGAGGPRIESLVPVTLRMCKNGMEEPDGSFTMDGRAVSRISFVARILSIESKETSDRLQLDDGTHVMDANWWHDKSVDDSARMNNFSIGMHVKGAGELKAFNNKRSINIRSLSVVEDHNEVTHFGLEVILAHLQATKGPLNKTLKPGQQGFPGAPGHSAGLHAGGAVPFATNYQNVHAPVAVNAATTTRNQPNVSSDDQLEDQIVALYQRSDVMGREEGITVEAMASYLKESGIIVGVDKLHRIAVKLLNDGSLYTTIDDHHFASTEC